MAITDTGGPGYAATMPYIDKLVLDARPRVSTIPPTVNWNVGKPVVSIPEGEDPVYKNESFGNTVFLRGLASLKPTEVRQGVLDWHYEMRYKAQAITPFLYLGPSKMARDTEFLNHTNITFLMAVRSTAAVAQRPSYLNPASMPIGHHRETGTFDLDTPFAFIRKIRPAIKMLVDHLEKHSRGSVINTAQDIPARIFVFCENGQERSAVFVAAFLMVIFGLEEDSALQMMQTQRICAHVDEEMKRMLIDLRTILSAERQVLREQARAAEAMQDNPSLADHTMRLTTPVKRTLDRSQEEDEAMEDAMEDCSRGGVAPFMDTTG